MAYTKSPRAYVHTIFGRPDKKKFREWLMHDRILSPSSARSYAYFVSSILKSFEWGEVVEEEKLKEVFFSVREKSAYWNYRTAWRAFTEWKLREEHIVVPDPPRKLGRPTVQALPEEALALAHALHLAKISIPIALSMKAETVRHDEAGGYSYIPVPGRAGEEARVINAVAARWMASWPTAGGQLGFIGREAAALFPAAPGGVAAYPSKGLRSQLKDYREKMKDLAQSKAPAPKTLNRSPAPPEGAPVPGVREEEPPSSIPQESRGRREGVDLSGVPLDVRPRGEQTLDPNASDTEVKHTTQDLLQMIEDMRKEMLESRAQARGAEPNR